ncbi:DUF1016 domain-containing protein [Candidatus Woesearchaeota archaeon]|nr:DUF1016 domain-containing protein [Candidatus Woesearchaeota archaeon]
MRKQTELIKVEDYNEIYNDIKFLLDKAKAQAYKAVDNIKVQTYWQIGERIAREGLQHNERADYGKRLIVNLAKDLGLGKVNLYYMVRFYQVYPIIQTVSEQLSWSHYIELIYLTDKQERCFYEDQSITNRWNVRTLRDKIKNQLYIQTKKQGKLKVIKPLIPAVKPEDVFKEAYHFDFLELKQDFKEKDLKDALLSKFEEFIKELGSDFFIGRREVPVLIGGNYDKIDLELFHAGLLCYILVEIKVEEFKHSHVSQMYSYLNWYKESKWQEGQRLPIGLIICKSKDDETVHYALGKLKNEIFIAEYKTKLPSEKEIEERIRR